MKERDRMGRAKYGTPLQAGNGRDALRDAYEEALDLAQYLRQAIEERYARSSLSSWWARRLCEYEEWTLHQPRSWFDTCLAAGGPIVPVVIRLAGLRHRKETR